MNHALDRQRIDKWLWAARFFKTRSLAVQAIERGRVSVNGERPKPARELKVGDRVLVLRGEQAQDVEVLGLSAVRGPAPVAQTLYAETVESIVARERAAAMRRLAPEPARAMQGGRPSKRDRRALDRHHRNEWDQRWSATLDDEP